MGDRDLEIRLLQSADDRTQFDCGVPVLNEYLQSKARQHARDNYSKTFVLLENGDRRVLGYYTLACSSIERTWFPEDVKNKLPFPSLPSQKIARLACDRSLQGTGVGRMLMVNAFYSIAEIAKLAGVTFVEVDPKDEKAKEFYQKFGFKELYQRPLHLYLPMKQITGLLSVP